MSKEFHIKNVVLYNEYSHYLLNWDQNESQLDNAQVVTVILDINY